MPESSKRSEGVHPRQPRTQGETVSRCFGTATNGDEHGAIAHGHLERRIVVGSTEGSTGCTMFKQVWSAGANGAPALYSGKRCVESPIVPWKADG